MYLDYCFSVSPSQVSPGVLRMFLKLLNYHFSFGTYSLGQGNYGLLCGLGLEKGIIFSEKVMESCGVVFLKMCMSSERCTIESVIFLLIVFNFMPKNIFYKFSWV